MPLQTHLTNIDIRAGADTQSPTLFTGIGSQSSKHGMGTDVKEKVDVQRERDHAMRRLNGPQKTAPPDAYQRYQTRHANASTPAIPRQASSNNIQGSKPPKKRDDPTPESGKKPKHSRFSKPLPPLPPRTRDGNWGVVDPYMRGLGVPIHGGPALTVKQAPGAVRRPTPVENRAVVARSVHCVEERW